MGSLSRPIPPVTGLAPLPLLLAYTERVLPKSAFVSTGRGVSTVGMALLWLVLAWRGSGRPSHLRLLVDAVIAVLVGLSVLPCPKTLARSLDRFAVRPLRHMLEAQYRTTRPRRARRWVALDAHQLPFWGQVLKDRFGKGWAGGRSRSLRGYRLFLATDTVTGQVITFLLVRGNVKDYRLSVTLVRHLHQLLGRQLAGVVADSGFCTKQAVAGLLTLRVPFIVGFARTAPVKRRLGALSRQQRQALRGSGAIMLGACPWDQRLRLFAIGAKHTGDRRGPWTYLTNQPHLRPNQLAQRYRQRWCVEQAIEELLGGMDLDHLVSYTLHPNRIAIAFRLLARNLQLGYQLEQAPGEPQPLAEWRRMRALLVEGAGTVHQNGMTIAIGRPGVPPAPTLQLLWSGYRVNWLALA